MSIIYEKKAKTQGHLREIMVSDYKSLHNSVIVWEKYKISHTTVLKWGKSENLDNKSSAPKIPHRIHDFSVLCLIHFLYEKEEKDGDEIQEYLELNWIIFPRSSMYYYLKQWWLIQRRKEKWKRINGKFKKYDPWFLHIDITYWPKINWVKYYIHIAIDRSTRLIYLEVHDNKRADTAANFLEKAITFFPFKIEKVLTDNWKEYTLKNHKWKQDLTGLFDLICQTYEIEHRTTKPYTPQTNGMVEKVNGTVKSNTLKIHEYTHVNEMKTDLLLFMVYYNLERRHSALKSEIWVKTPFQALEYWYRLYPEIFKENLVEFKGKLLKMKQNL